VPGFNSPEYAHAILLQAAVTFGKGVPQSGLNVGVARDTELLGYLIQLTAVTATTVSIAGFQDSTGAAATMLLSGQIATDVEFWFPNPILNEGGALVATPSAAGKVWLFTRAYVGP
jgi:hypothetical protein